MKLMNDKKREAFMDILSSSKDEDFEILYTRAYNNNESEKMELIKKFADEQRGILVGQD